MIKELRFNNPTRNARDRSAWEDLCCEWFTAWDNERDEEPRERRSFGTLERVGYLIMYNEAPSQLPYIRSRNLKSTKCDRDVLFDLMSRVSVSGRRRLHRLLFVEAGAWYVTWEDYINGRLPTSWADREALAARILGRPKKMYRSKG